VYRATGAPLDDIESWMYLNPETSAGPWTSLDVLGFLGMPGPGGTRIFRKIPIDKIANQLEFFEKYQHKYQQKESCFLAYPQTPHALYFI